MITKQIPSHWFVSCDIVEGDDYFIIKPSKNVPVFSYAPTLANLKFSTMASIFTREVWWASFFPLRVPSLYDETDHQLGRSWRLAPPCVAAGGWCTWKLRRTNCFKSKCIFSTILVTQDKSSHMIFTTYKLVSYSCYSYTLFYTHSSSHNSPHLQEIMPSNLARSGHTSEFIARDGTWVPSCWKKHFFCSS